MTKAPKLHFRDTGLALSLSGITPRASELVFHPFYPALVETFLVEEIIQILSISEPQARVYYFRTHAGAEVDLVIELGERLLPIEIKASSSVSPQKLSGLRQFLRDFQNRAPFGLVIYLGQEILEIPPNLLLIPWNYVI